MARVEYPSGREVLAAWWGFLSAGGLVLGERVGPVADGEDVSRDGEALRLAVKITSLKKEYLLTGRVRRQADGRAVFAFDAGQGQDGMLNAAWADANGVPERRHRRWSLELSLPVRYRIGDAEGSARLVNLSRGGCCLQADCALRIGTRLHLRLEGIGPAGLSVDGRVRWSSARHHQMGIEFGTLQDAMLVTALCRSPVAADVGGVSVAAI